MSGRQRGWCRRCQVDRGDGLCQVDRGGGGGGGGGGGLFMSGGQREGRHTRGSARENPCNVHLVLEARMVTKQHHYRLFMVPETGPHEA